LSAARDFLFAADKQDPSRRMGIRKLSKNEICLVVRTNTALAPQLKCWPFFHVQRTASQTQLFLHRMWWQKSDL